jgi:DNA-binding NtrC family response regulator
MSHPSAAESMDPASAQRRFDLLLLTEDERVIQKTRRLLEPGGYGVTVHHRGREGLEALRSGLYLICMVDQDLMDISGFEVVGQGKDLSPATEFIMLFEYPNLTRALLALSYGAYGYLTKPLDDLGALLTKIILAREKISLTTQLRTLMGEFENQRLQALDPDPPPPQTNATWVQGQPSYTRPS